MMLAGRQVRILDEEYQLIRELTIDPRRSTRIRVEEARDGRADFAARVKVRPIFARGGRHCL